MTIFLLCLCLINPPTLMADGILDSLSGNSQSEDSLSLGAGATVAVDDSGVVYLLDPASYQIHVYDRNLKPLRRFGGRGKGPGEFEEPKTVTLTPDNQPAVFDPSLKRLTVFDGQGRVLRTARLDASSVAIYHSAVLTEGRTAFLSARSHQGKPVYDLSLYTENTQKNLVRISVPSLDWSASENPEFWVDFLVSELELIAKGLPVMCRLGKDRLVYARSNDYKLYVVDADGRSQFEVRHPHRPKAFSEDGKMAAFESVWNRLCQDPFLFNQMPRRIFEQAVHQASSPTALPVLQGIVPFNGGFAVLADYDGHRRQGRFDLFDQQGTHQGSMAYEGAVDFMTGNRDYLFVVGPNQNEDISMTRLRIQ